MYAVYLVAHILEALGMYIFYSYRYESKKGKKVEVVSIALAYTLLFVLFCVNNLLLNTVANILMIFFISWWLYRINAISTLIQSVIYYVIITSSELLVSAIFGICTPEFKEKSIGLNTMMWFAVCSKAVAIVIVVAVVVEYKSNRRNHYMIDRGAIGLFAVIAMTALSLMMLIYIGYITDLSDKASKVFMLLAGVMFLEALLYIIIFEIYQGKAGDFYEAKLMLQRENDRADYYENIIENDNDRRILIHDIRNHLYVISEMAKNGKADEVNAYIETIKTDSSLTETIRFSDSMTLNYVLNRYVKLMKQEGIKYYIDARSASSVFMNDTDITSLFCNLYDNALEAAIECKNSVIELRLSEDRNSNLYYIEMENSCERQPIKDQKGKLVSKKNDNKYHGYGTKSIEKIVKKYNGIMNTDYIPEKQRFIVNIVCSSEI